MRIDILCADGSPIGVTPMLINGRGIGGAELALISLSEAFAARGHQVRVYNDPLPACSHAGVRYCSRYDYQAKHDRDVAILFRGPNPRFPHSNGKRVFWSCDQYTIGMYDSDVFPNVDQIVCISQFHADYFKDHYQNMRTEPIVIGLGVNTAEYDRIVEKVPNRFIFCSIPDRGLSVLRVMWPAIREAIPDATLTVTSDWTLWGAPAPMNDAYRMSWLKVPGANFRGAISRPELIGEQLQAEFQLYPCTYDELFCISCAECQVAGVIPITPDTGALRTTNVAGAVIPGKPVEVGWQDQALNMVRMFAGSPEAKAAARRVAANEVKLKRWDWDAIAARWEVEVFA